MIFNAISLAKRAHAGQRRKYTNEPYIMHPARVATKVSLLSYTDQEMIAAAWLHDVLEDTKVTIAEMVLAVGREVTDLVRELTFKLDRHNDLTYHQKKCVQNSHVAQTSFKAKSIKLHDRMDNLHDFAAVYMAYDFKGDDSKRAFDSLERYVQVSSDLYEKLRYQTQQEVDQDLVFELGVQLRKYSKDFNISLDFKA